ncbi:MAG TPA: hypothetical protein DCG19_07730 [Cryomorphaceae bacterium]|nr:hypothetical protein [Owenweeksia sp.]MBF97850.1 hypothetical protein [Owenweeksia sp.]HAD97281.1 hypothetical protein [Cryomorphaceae bacterium]|tara:strand:- start:3483 stop:6902 length:3420 start_codon:yes stop_codon:yes gene_type:complete
MQEILRQYASHETGLFLLNLPTGFGKTYKVLQYIVDQYEDHRPIYFVTNLKKNLPLKKLQSLFKEKGLEKVFDDSVLFIDGTSVKVVEHITELDDIPDEVRKWEEFRKLRQKARLVNRFMESKKTTIAQAEANTIIENEIRTELEPQFRNRLIHYIEKNTSERGAYASPGRKLRWIRSNAAWIIDLYPSVTTSEKKIFFMSVDKFFARNVTLIQPSYYFHDHKSIDQALVFIDEFDASKKPLLNNIIENGLSKRINLVALFQQIYTTLSGLQFPATLLRESLARQQKDYKSIQEILDYLEVQAAELKSEFHLDVPFKTVSADNKRNFIFHDFEYETILKEGFRFISIVYSEEEQVNYVHFEHDKNKVKGISLPTMLAKLRAYIQYFSRGIWMTALNYSELKQESGSDDFPLESALRTVLDLFNLDSLQVNYIMDIVANQHGREVQEGLPRSNYLREHSFYMNGFRYYDFVDSENHDLSSRIYLNTFEQTPEKLMLKLAQRANVIGISATATVPTVLGNYDLNFLRQRLGENFRTVNEAELAQLKERFRQLTVGYGQLEIKAELVKCEDTQEEALALFEDAEYASEVFKKLNNLWNTRDFHRRRYLRAAHVFKHFLLSDTAHSFLYLGNALPRVNHPDFDEGVLKEMFNFLIEKFGKSVYRDANYKPFVVIDSERFELKKKNLLTNLSSGQKLFMVSTYQTLGAGQNLQYPVPENMETVVINTRHSADPEKDIDGIYCERPTHLLVNKFGKSLEEKELVQNIFEVEFLAETGEISTAQLKHEIKKGFKLVSGKKPLFSEMDVKEKNLYSKDSFAHYISKMVIQAIGRISRTNRKSREIHILAHHRVQELLRTDEKSPQIYLHEYEKLLEKCNSSVGIDSQEEECFNVAERKNRKARRLINSMLHKDFEEENQRYWQQLRDFVLRNPRVYKASDIPSPLECFYFRLPDNALTYSYRKRDGQKYYNSVKSLHQGISEYTARLQQFMQLPELKAHFEEKGYAITFGKGPYIMNPVAFHSIYKGILGETIGKFLLEEYCYVQLQNLELDEYELFDFKTDQGIYIDFKHWFSHSYTDTGLEYNKLRQKLEQTGAQKALIINLIGSPQYRPRKKGPIIEIPYLINEENLQIDADMIQLVMEEINNL